MFPIDEYEDERTRQRERAENAIYERALAFSAAHLMGLLFFCTGAMTPGTGQAIVVVVGVVILLISVVAAVWSAMTTLRTVPILRWHCRVMGFFPWSVICAESTLIGVVAVSF